jgi:hypothetical protein
MIRIYLPWIPLKKISIICCVNRSKSRRIHHHHYEQHYQNHHHQDQRCQLVQKARDLAEKLQKKTKLIVSGMTDHVLHLIKYSSLHQRIKT